MALSNFALCLLSISKFDERSAFLYVLHNAEDFQIYFCTEIHCRRSVLFPPVRAAGEPAPLLGQGWLASLALFL